MNSRIYRPFLFLGTICLLSATLTAQTNTFPSTGNVGVGITSPQTTLHVQGTEGIYSAGATNSGSPVGGSLYLGDSNFENSGYYNSAPGLSAVYNATNGNVAGALAFYVYTGSVNSRSEAMRILPYGNVGIGTTAPGAKLDVAGNIKLSGSGASITFPDNTVQSTAWSGTLCGGDYAESVDITGERTQYEPGDVLVIDPSHPGHFLKSTTPYSRLVAGIYSTKPGLIGRRQTADLKQSTSEIPMAMVGIVPTKVTTESGPIEIGDLVVTSSKPGYAMKGTEGMIKTGSVIGKALGSLSSGTGVVEVLVSLQ